MDNACQDFELSGECPTDVDEAGIENGMGNCVYEVAMTSRVCSLTDALERLQKACTMEPKNVKFLRDLAKCYFAMNKYEDACNNLLIALEQNEFDPKVIFELGLYYFSDKKYKKTTSYLKRALLCDPDNTYISSIYYHIALAYCRLEKFEKAIFPFSRCIERDPTNIMYIHERAKAY